MEKKEWEEAASEFPASVRDRMIALRDAIITADSINKEYANMYKESGGSLVEDLEKEFRQVGGDLARSLLSRVLISRGAEHPRHIVDGFNFSEEANRMGTELGLKNGFYGQDVMGVDMGRVSQAIVRGILPVTRPVSTK